MIVKVGIVLRGVCVLLLLVRLGSAHAADSVKSRNDSFCQGSNLLESLARRRSIAVESISLRELLNDIQAEFGICLILDRRIDPSTRMVVTTPLVRTDQLLQSISDELPDCGVSVGRELVYFGPRQRSEQLRTLTEQHRAVVRSSRLAYSKEIYSALAAKSELRWPDLASPRELVTQLAADVGLELTNPQEIPHDLWKSGRMPRLSFVEAATVLLIQFDRTIEIQPESSTCSVVEIPADVAIKKQHSIPRQMRNSARTVVEAQLPELDARWAKTNVQLRGTLEEHEQLAALLRPPSDGDGPFPTESLKSRVLTLSIPDGLTYRQVIAQLQQSGVRIRDEASLGAKLDVAVSMELKSLAGDVFFVRLFQELPVVVEVLDDEVVLHAPADQE